MTASEPMSAIKLALLAKEVRARLEADGLLAGEPIAVIGMACRLPGGVDSPEALWELVRAGGDAIGPVPPDRWPTADEPADEPGIAFGGFLDGIDRFDAAYFGISPREAAHMDPQQRLVLEVAVEALERAGLPTADLAGSLTGVFVASTHHDQADRYVGHLDQVSAHTLTGSKNCIIPNRLSFLLDLRGPSVTVDTACSSSLVALHLACRSLRERDTDLALAGGVNVMLEPDAGVALGQWGVMAPDGRCKTFDAAADGFGRGEGCGIVVLKRLADAIADGDPIVGVVRGTAVNQDGRSTAMSAPNGPAQEDVVRRALRDGAVPPALVGCVEAHGTGTIIGDPIEVEALTAVLGVQAEEAGPLALGAVKANIGHLEAAAGVAGLIKALLCLQHEEVPPVAGFTELNPHISLAGSRLFVPTEPHPWPRSGRPRFAGVSSFGFGGTNAHVVVEEAPLLPAPAPGEGPHLLVLSAAQPDALRATAARAADWLATAPPELDLTDVCATAALHRDHRDERLAIVGATRTDLVASLRAAATGEDRAEVALGRRRPGPRRRVAFVFSGQGTQWWGMARDLLVDDPVFRQAMERCDAALAVHTGRSVLADLDAGEAESRLDETEVAQPAIFAVQVALAARWAAWGITPDAVVGHSVGEVAAAHVAGVLDLDQAAAVIAHRSRLMQAATGTGTMASVALPAADLADLVDRAGGALTVAAVNAPAATVLAGDTALVDAAVEELRARGADVRPLGVDYAFHSRQMAPHGAALTDALEGLAPGRAAVPVASTVTGALVAGPDLDAGYWGRNVAEPVRFAAAVDALADEGVDVFLEIGPNPVLGAAVLETLAAGGRTGDIAASLRRGRPGRASLLAGLGRLHVSGVAVDWTAVVPGRRRVVDLPTYPWQRERHWHEISGPARSVVRSQSADPLVGRRIRSSAIDGAVFELDLAADAPALLGDHRIGDMVVVPATVHLAMATRAATELTGVPATVLRDVELLEALVLTGTAPTVVQVHLQGGPDRTSFTISSLRPDDSWTVHARGTVSTAGPEPAAPIDPSAVRAALGGPTPAAGLYAELAAQGVHFGPAFRLVDTVWTGTGEAMGSLPVTGARADGVAFAPAVLDAALHPLAGLLAEAEAVHLPIALDELRVHAPLAGPLFSVVRERESEAGAGARTVTVDVALVDAEGTVVAEMVGLRVVATSVAAVARIAGVDHRSGARPSVVHELRWDPSPVGPTSTPSSPCVVVADRGGVATDLVDRLQAAGATWAFLEPDDDPERGLGAAIEVVAPGAGDRIEVVHLRGLDTPTQPGIDPVGDQERSLGSALAVVRALASIGARARLWLVTRGAQAVDSPVVAAEQATLVGLAATIRSELGAVDCVAADLDPADGPASAAGLAELVAATDDEDVVAWRQGVRRVARLVPVDVADPAGGPVRLVVGTPGVLDSLRPERLRRRAPGLGEVEVEVRVTGLNFREVLIALDLYPERVDALGEECSGIVTRVGPGATHLAPGQRVVAIGPGAFASHVTLSADLVAPLPDALDLDDGATIPLAFLTAECALVDLAGVRAGDRVLIHAGSGGVGMAAIQIARGLGAEVIATAGTPAKRALLAELGVEHAFDSRSLTFADGVRAATGGAGVDVVLNSLTGDFIPRSLELLAPGGRFVEIGRRDVWDADAVAAVRPDVAYHVFFLGDLREGDPVGLGARLRGLLARFGSGELTPLPSTPFEWADAESAFRHMAQARHTGKIVVRRPAPAASPVRPDGAVLITGGLGGIGLRLAHHLAERGVRHLVLLGRRSPDAAAQAAIAAIGELGAEVTVIAADVTDREQLSAAMAVIAAGPAPLRGIVHAAGVLADGVLEGQTWEAMATALAPKVTGGRLLDELSAGLELDLVAHFTTAATALGAPGQPGYAAGNAFLDAFASQSARPGCRTVALAWGAWDDVGMTAAIGARDVDRMTRRGALPMAPDEALRAFDAIVATGGPASFVVARIDPALTGARPLLSVLRAEEGPGIGAPSPVGEPLVDTWTAMPAALRRSAVTTFLLTEAAKVLGLPGSSPVDARRPFQELGLDSLMAVELRNAIGVAVGRPQPATLLFDHPTLESLADRLLAEIGDGGSAGPAAVESAPPGADEDLVDIDDIAALTEEEAEALLLAELEQGGGLS